MDLVSGLKVSMMNVNGMNGSQKQKRILTYFDSVYSDIIMLVDTRLRDSKAEDAFINKTKIYDIYSTHSTGPTTSRGLSILINKTLPIIIKKVHQDTIDSNYIMIETELYGEQMLLAGLYGPNSDKPEFIQKIFDMMKATGIKFKIQLGDYNITRHPDIDNDKYSGNNNPRARKRLNKLMKRDNYHDYLREKNPTKKLYTYYSFQGKQRARLDYILHSEELESAVVDSHLLDMPVSDHRGVTIIFDFAKIRKGKGLWRFPENVLKMEDYPPIVHKDVRQIYMRYYRSEKYKDFYVEASEAERAEFEEFTWEELPKLPMKRNIKIIMEEILLAVIGDTAKFSHKKKSKVAEEVNKIRAQIQLLDMDEDIKHDIFINENRKLMEKIELLTEDSFYKQDVEWIQAGERLSPTLKSVNSSTKSQRFMPKLIEKDTITGIETEITKQNEIEQKQKGFFETLYKKGEVDDTIKIDDFLPNNSQKKKICKETRDKLDGLITLEELTEALEDTSNKSCPGEDGFSYTFYKAFWSVLKYTVLAVANRSLISRKLPTSQRNGIINMIPKGTKDKRYLDNWRPIMLLNCLYKIISSVMARRLQQALKEIISPDQTGFLQDRYINENNVITCEVLEDAKKKNKLGLMLAIDFSKAFDCLSHAFIRKSLAHFGFGEKYISYVNTLITDFQAAVLHAGNISDYFKLQRGAKQGDPLAALLFILAVEILSIRLKEDPDIKHYKMDGTTVKLILYADDLNLFMEYDEESLRKAIKILDEFKNMSGLIIQVKKTQVVLLGRKYNESTHKLCRDIDMRWDQKFKLLGLEFNAFSDDNTTVNYDNKLDEIFDEMASWRNKFISIRARKNIVTGLFLSKLTHIAAVLPNLEHKKIKKIESRLYEFIWGGTAKLEREEAKLSFEMGGLNYPDLKSAWHALKLSWIRRIEYGQKTKWYALLQAKVMKVDKNLDINNITAWSTCQINKVARDINSKIWKSIFDSLKEYIRKDLRINNERALKHNMWGMGMLKTNSGNRMNLSKVRTLEEQRILPVELLNINENNVEVKPNEELYNAFPTLKKNHIKNATEALATYLAKYNILKLNGSYKTPCRTYLHENIHKFKKGSGWWVKSLKFNENILKNVRKRENKWREKLSDNSLDRKFWDDQYKMVHKISFDNKIQMTQFQIMKGNLKTNYVVHKFKTFVPEECTFCNANIETIEHLFFNCPETTTFIRNINRYLPTWTMGQGFTNIKDFLFISTMKKLNIRETFKLLTKYYIWRTRCSKNLSDLNLEDYKKYLYTFLRPHKQAKSLDFLADGNIWTELLAANNNTVR